MTEDPHATDDERSPANSEMESRMSQQTPEQPTPPVPTAPPAQQQPAEPEKGKQPPWGDKPENFDADEAWKLIQRLRNEKGNPDQQLRSELTNLQQQQAEQQRRLAEVFGVKPEETSDTDKLAQTVSSLQQQILASERRALAAEHKVPESLLTGSDAAAMKAQAEALVEFATASHVAATPGFQQNPGQGQGGAPLTPEAQAAAEYEKYYPSK